MVSLLLDPALFPFTVALAILFGLMIMELLAALLGGTLLGMDGDADLDLDLDADFDVSPDFDLDADFDLAELEAEIETATQSADGASGSDWLGLSKVPTLIWVAAALLAFGLSGVTLQTIAQSVLGTLLSPWAVAVPAAFGAVWFSSRFSSVFARFIPKSESSAVSVNHLGRRRGIVSQGTAQRGRAAEVRVMDGHGNAHYLRAEPLRDDAVIPQGSEVLVLRKSLNEGYRLVALT